MDATAGGSADYPRFAFASCQNTGTTDMTYANPVSSQCSIGSPVYTSTINPDHLGGSPQAVHKRKRSINPQGDENFMRALEAVRIGGIGFCKAAKMYGVNNRTLWLEYKKRGYPNNRLSIKNRKPEIKQEQLGSTNESMTQGGEESPPTLSTSNSAGNELVVCTTSHPMAMVSGAAFMEGRHVDLSPVLQRPRYLDAAFINAQQTLNLQGINFEQM